MGKKGQSGIITTILLILVALAAIALIAAFLINQVRTNVTHAEAKSKVSSISIEVKEANVGNNYILLQKTSSDSDVGIGDVEATVNGQSVKTTLDLNDGWQALEYKKLWLVNYTLKSGDKVQVFIVPTNVAVKTPTQVAQTQAIKTSTENTSLVSPLKDKSLVIYYPLESDTLDYSGNGYHGVSSFITFVSGIDGNGAKFSTNSSSIEIPSQSPFNFSEGFTLSAWVKPDGFVIGSNVIMGKYLPYTAIAGNHAYLRATTLLNSNYTLLGITGTSNTSIGNWYHIAATGDKEYLKLYVNGILENTTSINGIVYTYPPSYIGYVGRHSSSSVNYFNGTIDEVRFYNRTLSSDEIVTLYANP